MHTINRRQWLGGAAASCLLPVLSDGTGGALDTLMWDIYRQVIG